MTRQTAIYLVAGIMGLLPACGGGSSPRAGAGGGSNSAGMTGMGSGGSSLAAGGGGVRGNGGASGGSSASVGNAGGAAGAAGSHGAGGGAGGASASSNSAAGGSVSDAASSGTGGQQGGADAGAPDAAWFQDPETPKPVNGATTVSDPSGGSSVSLGKTGQGAQITGLPAASKLAIHYASVSVGTISAQVNSQTAVKVNVHSSGAMTGSFLYAIISIDIPANASVTVSQASGDVAVNIDQMIVGDGNLGLPPDIWNLPTFQPAAGPYAADWTKLGLTYSVPEWWRDAKFGGWAHWDPQSEPEQGDWYAYHMYQEGSADFNYQVAHYGDPGGSNPYGYKDLCENWKIDQWDPSSMMNLYVQMGAKFFMAMGSHHDNFANYSSVYQDWNAVNLGVKQDIVGTWAPLARKAGLKFGVSMHNTPARTWGQWMPVRYTSDSKGPYDALQTILDGKGKWWEGMDPVNLYGYQHTTDCSNAACNNSPYGTQFMYRVDEVIEQYQPDFIYFDDHAGDSQLDLGVHMGFGPIAPTILANYYNRSSAANQGKPAEVVMTMKGIYGEYDSFQDNEAIVPYVQRAVVRCSEDTESDISAYPFLTDWDIQDGNWHYMSGAGYYDAVTLVTQIMQNVARNASFILNLTQHGRGNLDPQPTQIAQDIGAWLAVNGEAVYSSRPFETAGDDTVQYSRNNGNVYATLFGWNGGAVTLKALASGGATIGTVSKVELLGSTVTMTFVQNSSGLTVTPSGSVPAISGISNQSLASGVRTLRITHDKGRFNDDDPGATYPGWLRTISTFGTGDYNNDLTTSTTVGDVWTAPFTGTGVSVYAPKQSGNGKIQIQVDGQNQSTADLSTTGARQAQQMVAQVTGLTSGQHTISITNMGPGPVAIDAISVP
ncbi:MAG: alpha-L-fucosidase [Polyangia bacterium]